MANSYSWKIVSNSKNFMIKIYKKFANTLKSWQLKMAITALY